MVRNVSKVILGGIIIYSKTVGSRAQYGPQCHCVKLTIESPLPLVI